MLPNCTFNRWPFSCKCIASWFAKSQFLQILGGNCCSFCFKRKSEANVSRKVSFRRAQNSCSMDLNNSLGNTIRHNTTQNKRRREEQPESPFTIQFHFNFNINFHENMMLDWVMRWKISHVKTLTLTFMSIQKHNCQMLLYDCCLWVLCGVVCRRNNRQRNTYIHQYHCNTCHWAARQKIFFCFDRRFF